MAKSKTSERMITLYSRDMHRKHVKLQWKKSIRKGNMNEQVKVYCRGCIIGGMLIVM